MKDLSFELRKLDSYSGIEYAQRIIELYKEFSNNEKQIDKYIENRVNAIAASADKTIERGVMYKLGEVEEALSF